jgi:hypothetical protein
MNSIPKPVGDFPGSVKSGVAFQFVHYDLVKMLARRFAIKKLPKPPPCDPGCSMACVGTGGSPFEPFPKTSEHGLSAYNAQQESHSAAQRDRLKSVHS